jgi:hypothetical protein
MFETIEKLLVTPTAQRDASVIIQVVVALIENLDKSKFSGSDAARNSAIDAVVSYLQDHKVSQ